MEMASLPTTQQPMSVGPFGGRGGRLFDDGTFTGIRKITVSSGEVIDSITIVYEDNGNSETIFHGGDGGASHKTIILDYPDEFLVSVWGTIYDQTYVGSLTLQSNKKIYGPFGIEQGERFRFPSTGGKIIGFHGKSSVHLDSIGVYFEPTTHNPPSSEITPLLRDSESNTISLNGNILYYLVSVFIIGIELTLTIRRDNGEKANSGSFIMSCVLFAFSVGITITSGWGYLRPREKDMSNYDYESVLNILDLITVSGLLIDNSIGVVYLLTQRKIKVLRIPASMIAATIFLLFVRRPSRSFRSSYESILRRFTRSEVSEIESGGGSSKRS